MFRVRVVLEALGDQFLISRVDERERTRPVRFFERLLGESGAFPSASYASRNSRNSSGGVSRAMGFSE
ncbi:hypothetical protein [Halorussus caseinilyticus]|uniref:Uncharacterized protein n=1 Tax=Halorussus caseinilyticus TaxID=3034025 RepID=A0ABD5WFI2_9EURY